MQTTLLVIDIGTTNCKTVLFAPDGVILDRTVVGYPTYRTKQGWVEQDPEEWWAAVRQGIQQVKLRVPSLVSSIAGISVTGHMHSLVCLGPDGTALMRAAVLGDQRSIAQADAITVEMGMERVYALTGTRMDASMPAAKLRWLGAYAPDIHRDARAFLSCKDFVRHRLTGDLLTDPIDACGTSLYDLQQRTWSPELVAMAGVRASQLPDIADPCQLAGTLREDAARDLGLGTGIPVAVGAGDDVEVLGNGLVGPGLSLEHLGTTGSILTCADRPVYDPEMAVELYPHIMPGLWVLGGSVTSAGAALEWSRQVLRGGQTTGLPLAVLSPHRDVDRAPIFVPHLAGERCPAWEPRTRGAWMGLSAEHTADDLSRAVYEGVAFSLKSVLVRIEGLVGRQDQIRVSGSDSADDGWPLLRSSVYERPLALLNTVDPTALGAVMLIAVGLGIYDDLAQAVEAMTAVKRLIEPDASLSRACRQRYRIYRAAEDAQRSVIPRWETYLEDDEQ